MSRTERLLYAPNKRERLYWSNDIDQKWNTSDAYFYIKLVPKRWWSIKCWILAYQFNKNIRVTGMAERKT